jgi:hypothetical protein
VNIVFSRHSLERMAERSIDPVWAERTLREPDFERHDAGESGECRAFRQIPEAGNRWLRVVYRLRGEDRFVITVFLDRKAENWR